MAMRRYHDFVLMTDDPEPGEEGNLAAFGARVFQSPAGEGERKERVSIPGYEGPNAQRRPCPVAGTRHLPLGTRNLGPAGVARTREAVLEGNHGL